MLINRVCSQLKALCWKGVFSYVHLERHKELINPPGRDPMSYENPKYVKSDQQVRYDVRLGPSLQKRIEREKFKEFRNKMILSQKDPEVQVQKNPIWQDEPIVEHYLECYNNSQLYTCNPYEQKQRQIPHYLLTTNQQLCKSLQLTDLSQYTVHHLVELSIRQRNLNNTDRVFWNEVQKLIHNKYNHLTVQQLIKLKYCFANRPRFGTAKFHKILDNLIEQEINTLNPDQLLMAYCAYKLDRNIWFQDRIVKLLLNTIKHFSEDPAKAIEFWRIYIDCRIPIHTKKLTDRQRNETEMERHKILEALNFSRYILQYSTPQILVLMTTLHKSRVCNINDLFMLVHKNASEKIQQYGPKELFQLLFTLAKSQKGQIYYNKKFYNALKPKFLLNWQTYNDFEKVRIVFCYWNVLDWDQFKELYFAIPIQSEHNILYFMLQIDMVDGPVTRMAEFAKAIARIDYVPVMYYSVYKQFFFHLRTSYYQQELSNLVNKYYQTQILFDVLRLADKMFKNPDVISFGKILATIPWKQHISFEPGVPIENLWFVQFADQFNKIVIEIVLPHQLVPGTKQLNKVAKARQKSLRELGWYTITIDWEVFRTMNHNAKMVVLRKLLLEALKKQKYVVAKQIIQKRIRIQKIAQKRNEDLYTPAIWDEIMNQDIYRKFQPPLGMPADQAAKISKQWQEMKQSAGLEKVNYFQQETEQERLQRIAKEQDFLLKLQEQKQKQEAKKNQQ